jgi:hypothetical protein
LVIADTGGYDDTLDALLEPYVNRGAVTLFSVEGERAPVRRLEQPELDPTAGPRHPVTDALIERRPLSGAVYVNPDDAADEEIARLETRGVDVAVLSPGDPVRRDRHYDRDAARRIMSDRRRRWVRREDAATDRRAVPQVEPYAYVAQRLVAGWTDGRQRLPYA